MKDIDKFVQRVFKESPPKDQSAEKLSEMLKEKVEDLKEEGYSEAQAIDRAIGEFGEAEDYHDPALDREKRRHQRFLTIKRHRNALLFAALASLLIISILLLVNFVLLRDHETLSHPWSLIVSIGVLFWPLSLLYRLLNKKDDLP